MPTEIQRTAAARRAIIAAGGGKSARDKGRAFRRLAAHFGLSRNAIEGWYLRGRIPSERAQEIALLAHLPLHQVDPAVFPKTALHQSDEPS